MEGISVSMMRGIKHYWKRRGYRRLNGLARRRRICRVELGSNNRRRRFWRIKLAPKIRLTRIPSPKKMLVWLRDAYVSMMMRMANSRAMSNMNTGVPVMGLGGGTTAFGFGRGPVKEYDEKMIIQMYKTLMLRQAHFPGDVPRISSVIAACPPGT